MKHSIFFRGRGGVCVLRVSLDFRRRRVGGRASSEEQWRSLPCVLQHQEGKLAHASHLSWVVSGVEGGEATQESLELKLASLLPLRLNHYMIEYHIYFSHF